MLVVGRGNEKVLQSKMHPHDVSCLSIYVIILAEVFCFVLKNQTLFDIEGCVSC